MSLSARNICNEKNYSYQHVLGTLLVKFNKLAYEKKLNHREYRLMGIIIGLYNKKEGKAFPSTTYLAQISKMSKTSIYKALNSLVNNGFLIVIKTKGKRNNYYLGNLLINKDTSTLSNTITSTTCNTPHIYKHIKKITNEEISSSNPDIFQEKYQKTDDNECLNQNSIEYIRIKNKLKQWKFFEYKKIIKQYGVEKLMKLINIVENINPRNKGGYLRVLIKGEGNVDNTKESETLINKMIKHKYWVHKPSNKIIQVLPDIGIHLLIKYIAGTNEVICLNHNFIDNLCNFAPVKS